MNYKEKLEQSKYLQDEVEERIRKIVAFIADNFYENDDEDLYHPLEVIWHYEIINLNTTYNGLSLEVTFKDMSDVYDSNMIDYKTVEIPYAFLDATTDEELLELVKVDAKIKYKNELEQSKREITLSIQQKEVQLENVEKLLKEIEA